MRLLFLGPGFPAAEGTSAGSGIGTYLREITRGLMDYGYDCHVLVWGEDGAPREQVVDGVKVHIQPRGYWRVIERFWPESRNVYARSEAAVALHRKYRFDWIEIQSDEGVDIAVQRRLPAVTILRLHTTLAQMIKYKQLPLSFAARRNLARERHSVAIAPRILTHSKSHSEELRALYAVTGDVQVVHHGIDLPSETELPTAADSTCVPSFLAIGTPDRRKGFDRLRAALESYVRRYGRCHLDVISNCDFEFRAAVGLAGSLPDGLTVTWRSELSDKDLLLAYRRATVLVHLARYESFGLPLVEAAAVGTPIVCTAVGIAPELLRGSLERLLVDGDSPDRCANALAEAVRNRAQIGGALAQIAREEFGRKAMVNSYLNAIGRWSMRRSVVDCEPRRKVSRP